MAKLHTIFAPTREGNIEIQGYVALLNVGDRKHKFLLQQSDIGNEVFLTDYASGMKFGSLTPIKFSNLKSYSTLKDREAAQMLIDSKIESKGIDRVNVVLSSAMAIN